MTGTATSTAALDVTGLTFRHGADTPGLSDVSLTVRAGEVCTLLGPNGAGKTTLLRCVLGLLPVEAGRVIVTGHDLAALTTSQRAQLVAYVPQRLETTFPFSALDIAAMGCGPAPADRCAALDVLDDLGVGSVADRPFSLLSGGERQLVMIARALVQDTPVLVLDEPTAALDYGNAAQVLAIVATLAAAGRAVLMATHQPEHALGFAGPTVLLRDGRVVADGTPEELVTGPMLSGLYGVPVHVGRLSLPRGGSVPACVPLPATVRRSAG